MMNPHFYARGTLADGNREVVVTPSSAGWNSSGIIVVALGDGEVYTHDNADEESVVLPLSGTFEVVHRGETHTLMGRPDVFAGATDSLYLPLAAKYVVRALGNGKVALLTARASRHFPVQYLNAQSTPRAQRGHGNAKRHANEFCVSGGLQADRLVAMEVYTPPGNWSSYPPHKHDQNNAHETQLEEIYYFEIEPLAEGSEVGFFRAESADDRPLQICTEVASGDVALVPYGWHGPAIAPPSSTLYYLNVMAGGGSARDWRFSDDPRYAWIRREWELPAPM